MLGSLTLQTLQNPTEWVTLSEEQRTVYKEIQRCSELPEYLSDHELSQMYAELTYWENYWLRKWPDTQIPKENNGR